MRDVVLQNVAVPAELLGAPCAATRIEGGLVHGDLVIRDGRVADLCPGDGPTARLVLPALVEPHCHLDKCHTITRMDGIGGDLADAIAAQARDKVHWTAADLTARASRGLDELVAAGCGLVRSHVDWGDGTDPPLAWQVLGDLAVDISDKTDLERAALVNIAMLADADQGQTVARHIARTGGALGSFVLDQPDRRAGLYQAFALADRYGLALDFHVDEGLIPGLDGVEMIAGVALETGFQGPVLCGHGCGLMNLAGDDLTRVIDKLATAGITLAALPTTNLYLQGRTAGTPDRRGLTRLRELRKGGVAIAVGSDNVADAFCPTGRHDPMAALNLAVLAAHLDPPLGQWLGMVTTDAARALGREPTMVIGADIAALRVSMARDLPELVAGRAAPPTPLSSYLEHPAQ